MTKRSPIPIYALLESCQRGFVMTEILLGLGVSVAVLIFSMRMAQEYVADGRARINAENFSAFQQIAAQHFMANRTEMLTAMADTSVTDSVKKHCVIKVANTAAAIDPGTTAGTAGLNGTPAWSSALNTCALDASLLSARKAWPGNNMPIDFVDVDTGGAWRYVAIFRRVMGPGSDGVFGNADDSLTENVEMLTVRMDMDDSLGSIAAAVWKNKSRTNQLWTTVAAMGATGGYIPIGNIGVCKAYKTGSSDDLEACGNGWKVKLNTFIDAAQITTLQNALPATL